MNEKKAKNNVNTNFARRRKSIPEETLEKFSKKGTSIVCKTNKNSPRNKRSISQLEMVESFQFKSAEKTMFNRSNSNNSLNIQVSVENLPKEVDRFSTTFKNMFENFSKLTEIMSSSSMMYQQFTEKKKDKIFKASKKKKIETYEPLSTTEKLKYIDEINRGSELRINAYNNIFSTIKNQISMISNSKKDDDSEAIERNLISHLPNPLFRDLNVNAREDKNVNIINNNITVNIISNDNGNKLKSVREGNSIYINNESKTTSNPFVQKGNNNGNVSITFNDEVEEENRLDDKNIIHSSSCKSKSDLERNDQHVFHHKNSENEQSNAKNQKKSSQMTINHDKDLINKQ